MSNRSNFYLLSFILSTAKYNVINNPLMHISEYGTNYLSVGFDDSGEYVWIAGCNMSSDEMEYIVDYVQSSIHDTLDIPVHVNGILIDPTDKPKETKEISYTQAKRNITGNASDSYILIFKSFMDAQDYLASHQNHIEKDNDDIIEAAASYFDTIVSYINKTFNKPNGFIHK